MSVNKPPLKMEMFAARLLMLSFFMPHNVQGGLFMIAGLYFPIRTIRLQQKISRQDVGKALLISCGYFLYIISIVFTAPIYRDVLYTIISNRASYVLLPVLLALTSSELRNTITREINYFVYGCTAICIMVNVLFVWQILTTAPHPITHMDYRIFIEQYAGIHPTYLSMYLCFAIAILLSSPPDAPRINSTMRYMLILALLAFMIALLTKSAIIALVLVLILYAIQNRRLIFQHKWLITGAMITTAAAYWLIPFVRQRLSEIFSVGNESHENAVNNSVVARKMIWDIDTDLLKHCWLTGVGPGKMQHDLNIRHLFYDLIHGLPLQFYDPHSEYMQQWLSFGLVGIVLLTITLLAHIIKAIRANNALYLYLILIFCIMFFTESVLSRQWGIVFYAMFTSLFYLGHSFESNQSVVD